MFKRVLPVVVGLTILVITWLTYHGLGYPRYTWQPVPQMKIGTGKSCLVNGRVVWNQRTTNNYGYRTVVEITDVYCGPRELVGKTFAVGSLNSRPDGNEAFFNIFPVPKKGTAGIWCLRMGVSTNNETIVTCSRGMFAGRTWPALPTVTAHTGRTGHDDYREYVVDGGLDGATQLAEAIRQYTAQASKEERVLVLKRCSESAVPQVARWAKHALLFPDDEMYTVEPSAGRPLPLQATAANNASTAE